MITEQEWLAATGVIGLDLWRSAKSQHRKWRLFAAACCRRAMSLVTDARLESVAGAIEQFADAEIGWEGMKRIRRTLTAIRREIDDQFGTKEALYDVVESLNRASSNKPVEVLGADQYAGYAFAARARRSKRQDAWDDANKAEDRQQLILARDIFGNPFRPVDFSPAWRTEHTTGIAAKMYDERDFAAMPILADALEEAGCEHPDILTHCREPGVHVRGCWVVDLVLGK